MVRYWGSVALGLTLASLSASALTLREVDVTCPYDGEVVKSVQVLSSFTSGTMLDFMPLGSTMAPPPLAVCPGTGFVFFVENIPEDVRARLRPFIESDDYQKYRNESSYYRASKIVEFLEYPSDSIATYLLYATWDMAGHRRYEVYARELLKYLPALIKKQSSADQKQVWELLAVELNRRIGDFAAALAVADEIADQFEPKTLNGKVLAYQRSLIAAQDQKPHRIPD